MSYTAPKGTQDILPADVVRWQWLEENFRKLCLIYGFNEIRTPIFEVTELFARGVGEDTDIVSKQMYSFLSRGGDALTLRPEGTAGVVRAAIQHNLVSQSSVQKLYYIGPTFRYERPQKGRYRQFHQLGVEAFGSTGPEIDAEILAFAADFLQSIGMQTAKLELNSVGCPECRPKYRDALTNALSGVRSELCPDCERRYGTNPLRILDCKVERCRELAKDVPVILDVLCDACKEHLHGVESNLRALSVDYTINPHIVRGLDYYTRTAFEFIAGGLGAQNTVLAGGRYDRLVEELGGPSTPAIGFAAGMERLLLSIGDAGAVPPTQGPVFIAALGQAALDNAVVLVNTLRRLGIPASFDYASRSLKAQLREANRQHAWYALIIGDNELQSGEASLRDMRNATQQPIELTQLTEYLQEKYR